MILYSAALSGLFFLLSAGAYYRPQQKTGATPNRSASYITNLRDKWADLSLSLCVVLEKGLNPSGSASVSQLETSQRAYMTPLFSSIPLWKSWLWPVFLFMLRMLSPSVRWASAQLLGSLFWTTRRGTPPLSPESSVNCCGLSRRTLGACGRYDSLLRV